MAQTRLMAVRGDSRFTESGMISTWTRFTMPPSRTVDWSRFRSVQSSFGGCTDVFIGRIEESKSECMLVMVWERILAYEAFIKSTTWTTFLKQLQAISPQKPVTQFVKFEDKFLWTEFSLYLEVHTVYFAASISEQQKDYVNSSLTNAMKELEPYVKFRTYKQYFGARNEPYFGKLRFPQIGWIQDKVQHDGKDATACLWVHGWSNDETEHEIKSLIVSPIRDKTTRPLIEAEEKYKEMIQDTPGAKDWTTFHVRFDGL